MATPSQKEAQRLRTALGLFQAGVDMMRQNLRRADPTASEEEIRARVGSWLRTRLGAEWGDGEGRPISWPRPAR